MSNEKLERLVESVARDVLSHRSAQPNRRRAVAIGADHGGVAMKRQLKDFLEEEMRVEVVDCGTHSSDSVDYPDIAVKVAGEVISGRCERGIVIDGAGIGSTMAANKVPGIRCALCHDLFTVENSRRHNDANVLALGANVVNAGFARTLTRKFLITPFDGGRHARRVDKIKKLDRDS